MNKYLQTVRQTFSRELVRHLAARLGESENAVGKALNGMVPVVLYQVVLKAGEGEGRALLAPVVGAAWLGGKGIRNLTEVLALLGSGPSNGALAGGEGLLHRMFGTNRPALDSLMSAYAGLRPASAAILLRLVATVLAVELAHYALRRQLTALRLSEEVRAANNQIYGWLPADLPQWPGFRRRAALTAPHAQWATELARPYWVGLAAAVVLALLVARAVDWPATRQYPAMGLLAGKPSLLRPARPGMRNSTRAKPGPVGAAQANSLVNGRNGREMGAVSQMNFRFILSSRKTANLCPVIQSIHVPQRPFAGAGLGGHQRPGPGSKPCHQPGPRSYPARGQRRHHSADVAAG